MENIKPILHELPGEAKLERQLSELYEGKEVKLPRLIFHPDSNPRVRWDVFVSLFITYSVIIVPLRIGFEIEVESKAADQFDYFTDAVFFLDILVTMRTAYWNDIDLIVDYRKIFVRYFFSWFFIDIMSTLPIDIMFEPMLHGEEEANLGSLKLLRLLRLIKLVRLLKLAKLSKSLDTAITINPALVRLFKLFFQIIFSAHLLACFWFLVSTLDPDTNLTWVVEHGLLSEPLATQYLGAFYWTIATMMSVGFGDIFAVNDIERIYSIFVQIFGAMLFGYMIANITAFIDTFDPKASAYREKMDGLKEYLRERNLPVPLIKRVKRYYEHVLSKQSIFDSASILANLPSQLVENTIISIYGSTAEKINMLKTEDVAFVTYVVTRMKPVHAIRGETLVERGTVGQYLYFLLEGLVDGYVEAESTSGNMRMSPDIDTSHAPLMPQKGELHRCRSDINLAKKFDLTKTASLQHYESYHLNNKTYDWVKCRIPTKDILVAMHEPGSHFGDIALLRNKLQEISYEAASVCHMYRLTKTDFEYALYLCPSSAWRIRGSVEKHFQMIQSSIASPTIQYLDRRIKSKICLNAACTQTYDSPTLKDLLGSKQSYIESNNDGRGYYRVIRRPRKNSSALKEQISRKISTKVHPLEIPRVNTSEGISASSPKSIGSSGSARSHGSYGDLYNFAARETSKLGEVINSIRMRKNRYHEASETVELSESQILQSWIIPPAHPAKVKWDLYIAALIIYSTIWVPLQISFQLKSTGAGLVFSYLVLASFTLDIVLTFRTAFASATTEALVIIPRRIAIEYFKGWFAIDFFSTFPFDLVMKAMLGDLEDGGFVSSLKIIKTFRLIRLLKLFRLLKLKSLLGNLDDYIEIPPAVMKLGSLVLKLSFISHFFGCFWFFATSQAEDPRGMWWFKEGLPDVATEQVSSKYIGSLYWAFSTMTTVGYGDIAPTTNEERLYAVVIMILGASVFGYVVGSIASLISMFDLSESIYKAKMNQLDQYLQEHNVPSKLRTDCKQAYGYYLTKSSVFNEEEILNELSPTLRDEILIHIHKVALETIPIFQDMTLCFFSHVVKLLTPQLSIPKSSIIRFQDLGTEIYFIISGNVSVVDRQHGRRYVLHKGHMFGHDAMLEGGRYSEDVVAVDMVHMYVLSKSKFGTLIDDFPQLAFILRAQIKKWANEQNKVLKLTKDINDLPVATKRWLKVKSDVKSLYKLSPARSRIQLHDMNLLMEKVSKNLKT